MADSYRLTVLKRLTEHLEGITPTNGYDYDLGGVVFRGRAEFGDSDPLPMLSILEATRPDIGFYAGTNGEDRSERWPLVIQGFAQNDKANPSDPAYALMAATEKRLGDIIRTDRQGDPVDPDAYLLGAGDGGGRNRLITGLRFGPGVVSPPRAQVSSNTFFYLPVWVGLAEKIGEPYLAV